MPEAYYELPETFPHTLYDVARAACEALGDQWQVLPGHWGVTGHLRSPDRIPFTIGVCGAGSLYLRNDLRGNSAHLPAAAESDPAVIGQAVADLIGHLY
ncbi:hypothetical protein [Streptomyces sp. NPDC093094]|uniref:hypothetical protein n=1 Tax=Streptomyces sp. NPDC093094 TaxID=3366026 RepID=UPI003818471B